MEDKKGMGGGKEKTKQKHWKENLNYLFCRTWLEQKPVQGRSLRTGVESHYLLIWKQTHDKKKMCTKTKKCSKRWHWGTGVWGTFSKIRLNWPHTEKCPKLGRSVLSFLFCIFYMGFCFLFFITVFLKKNGNQLASIKQNKTPWIFFALFFSVYFSYNGGLCSF